MTTGPHTVVIGDVEITRIQEYAGPSPATPGFLFPESDPAYWRDNAGWLDPDFFDARRGQLRSVLHTWLIRSQGAVILLDTGAGNGKERPYAPVYAHHDTAYLANLAAAGIAPEDVDIVINTHLHVDHVGWDTRLEGRGWVPTFPNARYLITQEDFEFWDPVKNPRPPADGNQNVFEDSVVPVHRAGLVELWSGEYRIDSDLVLQAAPGHTPGSAVLRLESGNAGALFVGDIIHSPVQIANPDVNSCFCEDPALARASRRRLLAEAAERSLLVFPAHFGGHSACHVAAADDVFVIRDWADLTRI
ncbi:MBL fold metallo-hydrolase [Micromonospora sp. CB01531]|uniref:MBL fold metallo-hydrolase n=1 Tax=Micromonospora sp. CB01531 TaxID=1718947 RepID=UPI00093BBF5D|nr:MBL fold metallo-hydrolase [Micromonospora sp. CB01531]OKI49709.1 MBL fold metallo-hydrolase [Micromonospora sp. CB01531]